MGSFYKYLLTLCLLLSGSFGLLSANECGESSYYSAKEGYTATEYFNTDEAQEVHRSNLFSAPAHTIHIHIPFFEVTEGQEECDNSKKNHKSGSETVFASPAQMPRGSCDNHIITNARCNHLPHNTSSKYLMLQVFRI